MTKDEFYEQVTCIDDLIDFCNCHGFDDIVEGITNAGDFDSWVFDCIEEARSYMYWYDIRGKLNEMGDPNGDFFKPTGHFEYEDISEGYDLDRLKDKVVSAGYDEDFWDADPEEVEDDFSSASTSELENLLSM